MSLFKWLPKLALPHWKVVRSRSSHCHVRHIERQRDKTSLQESDYNFLWNSIWCFLFWFRVVLLQYALRVDADIIHAVGYLQLRRILLHGLWWLRSPCSDWKIPGFSLAKHLWAGFSDHFCRGPQSLRSKKKIHSLSVTMAVPPKLKFISAFSPFASITVDTSGRLSLPCDWLLPGLHF